jgi:hypothetical protein
MGEAAGAVRAATAAKDVGAARAGGLAWAV